MRARYVWWNGTWTPRDEAPAEAFGGTSKGQGIQINVYQDFVSPIDRKRIRNRKEAREHNSRYGVIDVGNEKLPPRKPYEPKGVGEDVKRAFEQLGY